MNLCKRILISAQIFSLAVAAALAGAQEHSGTKAASAVRQITIPSGWELFRGAGGLMVLHPKGWQIQDRGEGSFLAYRSSPGGGATALVLVEPIPKIEGRAAGVVTGIGQIYPELFPGVRVEDLRSVSRDPDVVTGNMAYNAGERPFRGQAMCFVHRQRGVLYAVASTAATWPEEAPVMKRILQNFFYAPPAAAETGQRVQLPRMVAWRDPLENAFACPVPAGWKVEGGLRRFSTLDVRPELLVTSPDGKILIRIGDAFIPPMILPSQLLQSYGVYEGRWYSTDGINRQFVMRYLPGTEFLTAMYLPQRVGEVHNLQARSFPELSQHEQLRAQQAGIVSRVDTGELTFDARTGEGARKGYAFVQTNMVPNPGMPGGYWNVLRFHGCLSAPESEPLARALLYKMVSEYRVDPNWTAQQLRLIGQTSQIMSQTSNEISDMIAESFKKRSEAQDRMFGKTTRALRGEVLLQDPTTGKRYEVGAGSNYYWKVEGDERFVGTESPDSPYLPNHWLQMMLPAE